jgi:hypothetical protein
MSILSQSAWWTLNKNVTKELGLDASILLSDLLYRQEYWEGRNETDKEGFFFCLRDEIENDTTLTLHRQNKALSILKDKCILDYKNRGVPPKTRFKINKKYLKKFVDALHEESEDD